MLRESFLYDVAIFYDHGSLFNKKILIKKIVSNFVW